MREIRIDIPEKPRYFWHVCQAPPKDVNLLELALDHEDFIATDKTSGKQYIISRIDFFVYKPGENIPFYVCVMALNMDEEEAMAYLRKTYKDKSIAFFFFKIKERL